ncbi:glutathione S-transferase family protein [Novosphingobium piscinae]|uniref:Glutathione S-transferase family protein n=1 Tax=Novosphingobium piscinae TaxID=1507448 RepID=A0A7X1FXA5_9SPHN|nr:glutathione S-transferase family protein [Novosphingobium piscinae]MBC2668720.1 glutathione S-transferase family protein [Novosphingobium piscinae]
MKLYGALLSPYVRKVALVAAEKGLDWTMVLANPGGEDAAFRQASPFGKIPAIDDDGFLLADSSAIVTYLEAKCPSPALLPAEPQVRGRAVWFDEFADTIYFAAGIKVLFHRLVGPKLLKRPYDEAVALQGEAELPPILAYLESVAPPEGWLVGEPFSLADIAVASVLRTLAAVGWGPDRARYPATATWYARVAARPAWQHVAAIEDARRR